MADLCAGVDANDARAVVAEARASEAEARASEAEDRAAAAEARSKTAEAQAAQRATVAAAEVRAEDAACERTPVGTMASCCALRTANASRTPSNATSCAVSSLPHRALPGQAARAGLASLTAELEEARARAAEAERRAAVRRPWRSAGVFRCSRKVLASFSEFEDCCKVLRAA